MENQTQINKKFKTSTGFHFSLFLRTDKAFVRNLPQNKLHLLEILKAVNVLKSAQRPLVIVGKGAAFAKAEIPVRKLVRDRNLPFLATPMGKGESERFSLWLKWWKPSYSKFHDVATLMRGRILNFLRLNLASKNMQVLKNLFCAYLSLPCPMLHWLGIHFR